MIPRKTKDQFIVDAIKVHNNLYSYKEIEYINSHTKINIICNNHGSFLQTPHNHLKGQGCPHCKKDIRISKITFNNQDLDNYILNNSLAIKRIGEYKNSSSKIKFKCLKCNLFWLTAPNSIKMGTGCPSCNNTKLSNLDIDTRLISHCNNIKRVGEYVNAYTKINWQCLDCNKLWFAKPGEVLRPNRGSGCPYCSKGKNEKIVSTTLDFLNIQHTKINIKLNYKTLYPDFYLPRYNTIIEYNGVQHYEPICFGNYSIDMAKQNLQQQQVRDQKLRSYCNDHNIKLLEIDGRKFKGNKLRLFIINFFKKEIAYE